MAAFTEFVRQLFEEGTVVLRTRPPLNSPLARSEKSAAGAFLEQEYEIHRLQVAGPLLPFDVDTALKCAGQLWFACWFLIERGEPPESLQQCLPQPHPAKSGGATEGLTRASEHLSADLVWRFLPPLLRRARALDPTDSLTRHLTNLLRHWPLSGVLSDVQERPSTPVESLGNPGLWLLYAERLAKNPRPAWVPTGKALEYAELVFAERNLTLPTPIPPPSSH